MPSNGATSAYSIFIASSTSSLSPRLTAWPCVTASAVTMPGMGATMAPSRAPASKAPSKRGGPNGQASPAANSTRTWPSLHTGAGSGAGLDVIDMPGDGRRRFPRLGGAPQPEACQRLPAVVSPVASSARAARAMTAGVRRLRWNQARGMAGDEAGVDVAGDEIGIGGGAGQEAGVGLDRPDLDRPAGRRELGGRLVAAFAHGRSAWRSSDRNRA